MAYTEKIKDLFDSSITSYRIAKDCGLSPQFVDNYRTGKSNVENMALGKAEILVDYKNKIEKMEEKAMYKLTVMEEGKLQDVENFNNFEDLKNHLINTDYFSWINDNEPERELPDFTDVENAEDINNILEDYDYSWWTIEVKTSGV